MPNFTGWSILEVMGHRKLGGFVTHDPPEMPGLLRIDVYRGDAVEPVATQYYGVAAVFSLTPVAERIARSFARSCDVRPVATWDLPGLEAPRDNVITVSEDPDDEDFGPEDYLVDEVEDDEEDAFAQYIADMGAVDEQADAEALARARKEEGTVTMEQLVEEGVLPSDPDGLKF